MRSQAERSLSTGTALLQNTAAHKNKKLSAFYQKPKNLLPYSKQVTCPHSEPAEYDQHPHIQFSLTQCYSFMYTQSTDVFIPTIFTHFSSHLCVPHALYFTTLHLIFLIQTVCTQPPVFLSIPLALVQKQLKNINKVQSLDTFTQNTQNLSSNEVLVHLLPTHIKCDYDVITISALICSLLGY